MLCYSLWHILFWQPQGNMILKILNIYKSKDLLLKKKSSFNHFHSNKIASKFLLSLNSYLPSTAPPIANKLSFALSRKLRSFILNSSSPSSCYPQCVCHTTNISDSVLHLPQISGLICWGSTLPPVEGWLCLYSLVPLSRRSFTLQYIHIWPKWIPSLIALVPLVTTLLLSFSFWAVYSLTTSSSSTYYQHILASFCSNRSLHWNHEKFTNNFYLAKLNGQFSVFLMGICHYWPHLSFLFSFLAYHYSLGYSTSLALLPHF